MDHVHFDLAHMETAVRRMYETANAEDIHDDADVVAVFRKAASIEIEMSRLFLTAVMDGKRPEVVIEALIAVFGNLILNRLRGFDIEGVTLDQFACDFCDRILNVVFSNVSDDAISRREAGGVTIRPVTSGTA